MPLPNRRVVQVLDEFGLPVAVAGIGTEADPRPKVICTCPVCLFPKARLQITQKAHLALYCPNCSSRLFSSSTEADSSIRAWQMVLQMPTYRESVMSLLAQTMMDSQAAAERAAARVGLATVPATAGQAPATTRARAKRAASGKG